MSFDRPNAREERLSGSKVITSEDDLAGMLAAYREELLREFVELQKDLAAMGDRKLALALQDLIDTARGVP